MVPMGRDPLRGLLLNIFAISFFRFSFNFVHFCSTSTSFFLLKSDFVGVGTLIGDTFNCVLDGVVSNLDTLLTGVRGEGRPGEDRRLRVGVLDGVLTTNLGDNFVGVFFTGSGLRILF